MYECDTTSDMCLPCLHQDITVVNTAVHKHRSIYVSGFLVKVWFLESLYNMNPLQGYFGVFLQIHIRLDFKQCAKYGCLLLERIEKNVDFRLMRNFSLLSFSKSNFFFFFWHLSIYLFYRYL